MTFRMPFPMNIHQMTPLRDFLSIKQCIGDSPCKVISTDINIFENM